MYLEPNHTNRLGYTQVTSVLFTETAVTNNCRMIIHEKGCVSRESSWKERKKKRSLVINTLVT